MIYKWGEWSLSGFSVLTECSLNLLWVWSEFAQNVLLVYSVCVGAWKPVYIRKGVFLQYTLLHVLATPTALFVWFVLVHIIIRSSCWSLSASVWLFISLLATKMSQIDACAPPISVRCSLFPSQVTDQPWNKVFWELWEDDFDLATKEARDNQVKVWLRLSSNLTSLEWSKSD